MLPTPEHALQNFVKSVSDSNSPHHLRAAVGAAALFTAVFTGAFTDVFTDVFPDVVTRLQRPAWPGVSWLGVFLIGNKLLNQEAQIK